MSTKADDKPTEVKPTEKVETAAANFAKHVPAHTRNKLNGLFGSGFIEKLIASILQGLVGSVLAGSAAAPAQPLDSVMAHHGEKLMAEFEASLTPAQHAALNGLNIDWKKLVMQILQAVLSSLTSTTVSESAPK